MNNEIIEDIVVDENLIHLENVLFDLDNYHFDKEIISKLNDLKMLVDNKLFPNFNTNGLDCNSYEIIYRFHLKKLKN